MEVALVGSVPQAIRTLKAMSAQGVFGMRSIGSLIP
jgi:hypothetical protein